MCTKHAEDLHKLNRNLAEAAKNAAPVSAEVVMRRSVLEQYADLFQRQTGSDLCRRHHGSFFN